MLTPGRSRPKRARKFEWKRRDELAAAAALEAAFELLPAARRGSDPTGDGWAVEVTDARDGPDGREYRVRWFVWAQGERAPLGKRLEWRRYADFVNRALAGLVLWACVHRPVVCYGCKEGNCFRHTGPD